MINKGIVLFLCIMMVPAVKNGFRVAHSVVSITTKPQNFSFYNLELIGTDNDEPPRTTASEFTRAVKEIVEDRKIEPFFYQYGRYFRIPVEGIPSFVLQPRGATSIDLFGPGGEIEIVEEHVRGDLLPQEVSVHVLDVHAKNVVLINGGAYLESAIEALPNFSRGFVLFPPYHREETVPIFEAKNQITRNQEAQKSNMGARRIPLVQR